MSSNSVRGSAPGGEKLAYLQENDLFRGMSAAEIQAMAERAPMKRVPAGTVFYSAEQPAEVLFILKEGRVRVYQLSPEGRTLTTAVLEAGSIFGEMVLIGTRLHDAYAEAMDPCLLCLMSREDVQSMLLADARVAGRLVEILGERLAEAQDALSSMVFKRTPERLAGLLLRRARPARGLPGTVRPLEVRHTHEELAEMLGGGRETVTKILNEWAVEGWVELGRGRVRLVALEQLRIAAGVQP